MLTKNRAEAKLVLWIFIIIILISIASAIIILFFYPAPTIFQYRISSILLCFGLSSITVLILTARVQISGMIGTITIKLGGTAALWLATLLIFNLVYPESNLDLRKKTSICGKITKEGRSTHDGIMIGIITENCKTFTNTDGSYAIEVLKGKYSYTGFAYFRDGNISDFYIGNVNIDPITKKLTFSYMFGR